MKIFNYIIVIILLMLSEMSNAQKLSRIEPPSWWVGMETPLQIMLYGKDIQGSTLSVDNKLIKINRIHQCDSPDYLFVDIKVSTKLKPGTYIFTLSKGEESTSFGYKFEKRNDNSSNRVSFGPQDMVYLLMPDRFSNGDIGNDSFDYLDDKLNKIDVVGRHGGDIIGMINSLDYLQKLGVTAIWPTPLMFDNEPKVSYHGYACSDYYKIDPRYGTNDLYREFVSKAKLKGIKIIQDFVPNHCGSKHWWVENPPFNNWINTFPSYTQSNFAMTAHADINASQHDRDILIRGWFDSTMPDMNLKNPFLLNYFTQNAIWWIEWADLSGIRVDTYPYSDKLCMSALMGNIRKEYKNISIVGESWFHTAQEVAYWEGDAKNRDGFDSKLTHVMDFPLQDVIYLGFLQDSVPNWGEGMFKIYKALSQDYVYQRPKELMIFADNHDTNRISELIKKDPEKLKMILTLLSTMRGIPQLYYGTEIMLSTKDGILGHGQERIDMPGGWKGDTKSAFTGEGLSLQEQDILNYTKNVFTWRKSAKAIHYGSLTHYWPIDNLYVYFREYENTLIMVLINNNIKPLTVKWNKFSENTKDYYFGKDPIYGKSFKVGEEFIINAQSSLIIEFKK